MKKTFFAFLFVCAVCAAAATVSVFADDESPDWESQAFKQEKAEAQAAKAAKRKVATNDKMAAELDDADAANVPKKKRDRMKDLRKVER